MRRYIPDRVFSERVPSPEEKRETPPAILAYVIRHGETSTNKMDPRRGLTEKGLAQSSAAAVRIAEEIAATYPKDAPLELRGYDSGMDRAHQTLIEVVKVLCTKGYDVTLPLAQSDEERARLAESGLIAGEGPGIRSKIRNLKIPQETRPYLYRKEESEGLGPVMTWLTEPEEELEKRGIETRGEAAARVEKAVLQTTRIAYRIREQKRHIVAIATTHGGTLEGYATKKLGLTPDRLGEFENCEGLKIEFRGDGKPPHVALWGVHAENIAQKK